METIDPIQSGKFEECENALAGIDLSLLLSAYGHFDKVGVNLVGYCPFHRNEEGSRATLVVKSETKEYHCIFPKCNQRGSIIQLVAKFENSNIDYACAKILNFHLTGTPLVQDTLPFVESVFKKEELSEYSQTTLRILRQCPLRYWNEYVKDVRLDKQTVESTIGSLVHSTLQEFYKAPAVSRQQNDLIHEFSKRWGKGYGPQDEREYWFQKAERALQNAYELNLNSTPQKTEFEITKSTYYPFDSPRFKLKSKADRIDWFDGSDYCIIDYKWDEKPFSVEDAELDFQTVLYYLTWTGDANGISPKRISYQFLTPGVQVDVSPTETTMAVGIENLIHYIERAENLKEQKTEPESTRNEYCYNCKLYGKCPATKP